MYRQNSVPDLPRKSPVPPAGKARGYKPTTRGAHLPRQQQQHQGTAIRRASSERFALKDGRGGDGPSSPKLGEQKNQDGGDDKEAAEKAKILERIQFLGSHLAGCMVEFLIEEVEKNVLLAYANAARMDDSTKKDSSIDDEAEDDNYNDNNLASEEEEEEEEEDVSEFEESMNFDESEQEEEDILSPVARSRGGVGAVYGKKLGLNSNSRSQEEQQPSLGRGKNTKDFTRRIDTGEDDSDSVLGLGGSVKNNVDASPNLPSRGIRKSDRHAPLSPPRNPLQVGSSKVGAARKTSLSPPPRNSAQLGTLPFGKPSSSRGCPGQLFLSRGDDDDEGDDEEEEQRSFLPSSTRKAKSTGVTTGLEPRASANSDFRRNITLPDRLDGDAVERMLRKSLSPTAPRSKLGLGRLEQGMDGSTNSLPRRPKRSVDSKATPFASDDMDASGASVASAASAGRLSPRPPGRSRLGSGDKSPSHSQAARIFESKTVTTPKSEPSRPRATRNAKLNFFDNSPSSVHSEDRPGLKPASVQSAGRPGLKPARLMVKQGSVRHVMGMFESKSKASTPSRPAMPFLREDSVKNIVDSLKEDEEVDDNKSNEGDIATNPNEAPDSSSQSNISTQPSRTKTPPRTNRNFSKSPSGSPKRGVQRNTSGLRMQRFLENKDVSRTNSGVKSFLSKKGSGGSQGSTGSAGQLPKPARVARKRSNNNVKRGVDRSPSGIRKALPRRTASGSGGRGVPRRQFSFKSKAGTAKSSSFGMFAKDKVTNQLSYDARKQKRIFKTQNALRKLKKASETDSTPDESSGSIFDDCDMERLLGAMSLPLPCGVKHKCALLFVDISGFTKLSTALKVEKLSRTINAYFQLIVEHVQAFGGDILKFAGDAVFVEWRASTTTLLEDNQDDPMGGTYGGKGLSEERAVITAAACAARIIDKCADYKVYDDNGKVVATLNLHCAIGFGEVLGVHLGNTDRMEYFIIGEPISQVAKAMDFGKMGEVVASPACLKFLDGESADQPKVILSKANKLMNPKLLLVKANKKRRKSTFANRLDDWDVAALKSLQKLMSPYVHPVVVENQLSRKGYGSAQKKGYGSAQERFTSEAEIRDVFTVFIQPMVSADVTGVISEDKAVLKRLHDIMVIVNNELRRFKGQLRQYTVDDKGIVLIANFGLRGSTFPQMVERLAMPFATNVQQILKTKLNVDCKMGATFGKAYCGVVGGLERHEYAVLGPSVNLAARLMANKSNQGFLVDEEVQRKASNRGFEGLPAVKAKGYKKLVPIFKPKMQYRRSWGSQGVDFVGRTSEIKQILKVAEDIIDAAAPTSMVWVSAESGYGKSALLGQATEKVSDLCASKSATHVIVCHVCSDADSFQPLSVVGPLFLDILAFVRRAKSEDSYKRPHGFDDIANQAKAGSEKAPMQVLGACHDAEVPDKYIRTITTLLIARVWPASVADDETTREVQINEVARYMVTILLQSTIHLDFVVWAIDDIPHADQVSWKVLELLQQYSCNFMLLCGSRPVVGTDMNLDTHFWDHLHNTGKQDGTFLPLELKAMTKDDLGLLVKRFAAKHDWHSSTDLSAVTKEVFVQSGGVPDLAAQILSKKSSRITGKGGVKSVSKKITPAAKSLGRLAMMNEASHLPSSRSLGSGSAHSGSVAQVGEHMLHRMDLLTPEARTHINLGAILGPAFETADVISVMERYRGISEKDREGHSKSVLASLVEAADSGILEEDLTGAGNSMSFCAQENFMGQESVTYKFTHDDWRRNILKMVLDSWKRAMYILLAESLEAQFEFKSARPDRAIRKLFDPFKGGRKKGKNISVASELALKIGMRMEQMGKGTHSLTIYSRALDFWQHPDDEKDILVMSEEDDDSPPDELMGEDLKYVLKLNGALGRSAMLLMKKDKSTAAFQTNLDRVLDSKDLKDPAVLFPSFAGRFYSLRLARKVDHETEADFVYSFVEEAEAHKDKIHTLQAFAMEAELFGRNGESAKALEACTDLRKQYDVSVHSPQLTDVYGADYCAQCLALSASWHFQVVKEAKALEMCVYIIEILPSLAPINQFQTLYPVLWVLKDIPGQAERALGLCREFLVINETKEEADGIIEDGSNMMSNWNADDDDESDSDDQDETPFSPFQALYKPITMLMHLTAGVQDDKVIYEYIDWALDAAKDSEHDKAFNLYTGSLGRNADSIEAEICLKLATHSAASSAKHNLMSRASALVASSTKVTKYMPAAYKQVKAFSHDEAYRGL